MTTAWYYDFYEPGKFPHQETLCRKVAWICSFEGQKRTSTTTLSAPIANPLTLRLRSLTKALNKLKREVNKTNTSIKKITNTQLQKSNYSGISGTLHLQDSHLKTEGAPVEEIEFGTYPPEKLYIYHKNVHSALFDYFVNLNSILDRLAYEINMLYGFGEWIKDRLDWNKLVNPKKLRFLNHLVCKDVNLGTFIKKQITNFEKVNSYRNRLLHDGLISTKIEREGFPRKFYVFLPQEPNDINSSSNVDAIEYCKGLKANILTLLDGSYKLMVQHYQTHGEPPW